MHSTVPLVRDLDSVPAMLPRLALLIVATGCASAGSGQATGDDDDAPPIDAPVECTQQTFYRDGDGDGHGDRTKPVMGCSQPAESAPNNDDCDDASNQRFPGNPEVCDGLDNDCSAITNDSCPVGCNAVRRPPPDNLTHVYLVCGQPQSWPTAQASCASAGFKLIQIEDAAENTFVRGIANTAFGAADIHIGGSDFPAEGVWKWDSGDQFWSGGSGGTAVGGRYENWLSGEPNDDGTEDCAEMKPNAGWNDDSCGAGQFFICRK
jgi:hypothetical protein